MNSRDIDSMPSRLLAGVSGDARRVHERVDALRALGRQHYWFRLAERLYLELKHDRVTGLAAELAYRFFLAFFPFLIFVAATTGYVASALHIQNPTAEIMTLIGDSLPREAADVLRGEIESVLNAHSPALLSLSMLGAIWIAAGGISTVISRVNMAFDVKESRKLYTRYAMAIGLALAGGALIILALALSLAGQIYGYQIAGEIGLSGVGQRLVPLIRYPIVVLLVFGAVSVLYWLSPDVRIPFRWVVPGSIAFVVGWLIASWGYGLYVGNFASYGTVYGTLGGVVITLFWFYITALVLLVGAELTAMIIKECAPELLPGDRVEDATGQDYSRDDGPERHSEASSEEGERAAAEPGRARG
jgi:membrane protein